MLGNLPREELTAAAAYITEIEICIVSNMSIYGVAEAGVMWNGRRVLQNIIAFQF